MKTRLRRIRTAAGTPFGLCRWLSRGVLAVTLVSGLFALEKDVPSNLQAHEWGTFTAIAGANGTAVEWSPLTEPPDLPGFVEHFSYANFKLGLRGTIRMETPVIYFYSARKMTVSVRVAFSKGIITEWYPHAAAVQPSGMLPTANLSQLQKDGSIWWKDVVVSPVWTGKFREKDQPNRYYAARDTRSSPLQVKGVSGNQQEKFLFYRGVSAAPLPLSVKLTPDAELLVRSASAESIPAFIFFERRGQKIGYRVVTAPATETRTAPPQLNGDIESLRADLEAILVQQGLYSDEAHAMVGTWQDSWFEEGSRLIYVVPRDFIDKVLPLTINPKPDEMTRVFVGRLEIVTPATAKAVETALTSNDQTVLRQYGRFLEPILEVTHSMHTKSARTR